MLRRNGDNGQQRNAKAVAHETNVSNYLNISIDSGTSKANYVMCTRRHHASASSLEPQAQG